MRTEAAEIDGTPDSAPIDSPRTATLLLQCNITQKLGAKHQDRHREPYMKKLLGALFSIATRLGRRVAGDRGARAASSPMPATPTRCFLDPVFNDANVDIWILTNLYDTLFLPTDDGKDVQPGLATAWKASDDGLILHASRCARRQVRRRHADDGRGREMVARSRRQSQERHLELPAGLGRQRRRGRAGHDHDQAEATRSRADQGARHLQHGDPAARRPTRPRPAPPTRRRPRPSPSIRSAPVPSSSSAGSATSP